MRAGTESIACPVRKSADEHLVAIIGAGSWGTALAIVLAPRFERIRLWAHETDLVERMCAHPRERCFPSRFLAARECRADGGSEAMRWTDAGIVVGVMPSRFARALYRPMLPHLTSRDAIRQRHQGAGARDAAAHVGSGARGDRREIRAAHRRSLRSDLRARGGARRADRGGDRIRKIRELAASIQREFSGPTFRLYTNDDPVGVELGAALKNIIAIGAGICQGLGSGQQFAWRR